MTTLGVVLNLGPQKSREQNAATLSITPSLLLNHNGFEVERLHKYTLFVFLLTKIYCLTIINGKQTSANWGPNLRFVLEVIFKPLIPNLIMKTLNCVHVNHNF